MENFRSWAISIARKSCMGMVMFVALWSAIIGTVRAVSKSTCSCFWVGWFRREERLDWNSEMGVQRARTGALI